MRIIAHRNASEEDIWEEASKTFLVPGALPLCYQYTAGEWTSRTQLEREHGEQRERLQVSAELQRAPPPSFNALSSASRRTLIDRGTPNELVLPDLLLSDFRMYARRARA